MYQFIKNMNQAARTHYKKQLERIIKDNPDRTNQGTIKQELDYIKQLEGSK